MSVIIILSGFLSDYLIRRGYFEITIRKTFIVIGLVLLYADRSSRNGRGSHDFSVVARDLA